MKKLMVTASVLLMGAGVLSGCSSNASPEASPSASPDIEHVKALIRTLFYDESQAYRVGFMKGATFAFANNYPGAYDKTAFFKCINDKTDKHHGVSWNTIPDASTVAPDQAWVGPKQQPENNDWLFAGKKPEGETYIVTVASHGSRSKPKFTPETVHAQAHITVLNDKAYYYYGACGE